jgi:hypothetical protein
LTGIAADDDLDGAFAIGQYFNLDYTEPPFWPPSSGVPADSMYYGIRRYTYSMDMAKNPLLFSNLAEQPTPPFYDWKGRGPLLNEVHTAGEIFAQALFQCFGNMVQASDEDFEALRLRKAQYLVAALMIFPENPTYLEARNALLNVMRAVDETDHDACRAGFALRGMGAGALGPERNSATLTGVENSFLDRNAQLRIVSTQAFPVSCPDCDRNERLLRIETTVRNAGLVAAGDIVFRVETDAQAVDFPEGNSVNVDDLAPETGRTIVLSARMDITALPAQSGSARFLYLATVEMGGNETTGETVGAEHLLVLPSKGGGATFLLSLLLLAACLGRRISGRTVPSA